MTPAKQVGGDFYDFFLVGEDRLAIVIADVSGKGIPAALFMMTARSLIRDRLMAGLDPAEAMESVNAQLYQENKALMFVTVWLAVLEISTGRGIAGNAGHTDPAVRRAGGGFELSRYEYGLPVGLLKKTGCRDRAFELHPGDCIFAYSDGVTEAADAFGKMFGGERMIAVLNECADAGPEALIRHVREAVDRFADGAPQSDDITMLCLKYHGTER